MLIAIGERRGRVYKASAELRRLFIKMRSEEPTEIHDPFEVKGELITA
jgi:hypothetical protein